MSGPITVSTEALDALASQLDAGAALAEGAGGRGGGGTLHPEVASALSTFRSSWDDRRSELASQLRQAAVGCRGVSAHATALDRAGASTLRGR
jgi:hypothetical protein